MKFEDILAQPHKRWPKKGDIPFKKTGNAEASGRLATDERSCAVFIMDGFMRAGAALADLALEESQSAFELVYPMLFCYRHAVETGLRWLIANYGPPVGVNLQDINNTHDLLILYRYFDQINKACGAKENDEALKAVATIIKQFHDWDKSGIKFRYATTKEGAFAQFQYSNVDIENLRDVMRGVANFFDGSDGWLDSIANA